MAPAPPIYTSAHLPTMFGTKPAILGAHSRRYAYIVGHRPYLHLICSVLGKHVTY